MAKAGAGHRLGTDTHVLRTLICCLPKNTPPPDTRAPRYHPYLEVQHAPHTSAHSWRCLSLCGLLYCCTTVGRGPWAGGLEM